MSEVPSRETRLGPHFLRPGRRVGGHRSVDGEDFDPTDLPQVFTNDPLAGVVVITAEMRERNGEGSRRATAIGRSDHQRLTGAVRCVTPAASSATNTMTTKNRREPRS